MVSFLGVTGIKLCPDISPNQNALRIASGTEPTLIRKEDTTLLTVVQFLCSLHHCKLWRRWSTFKGRQRSGRPNIQYKIYCINISELLEPVVLPYLQGLVTAIFQQDNARSHVARIVQRLFVNHQIELLSRPDRSKDLSPIENMWFMIVQRLTQITPPAATPDQLWQRVESACSAVLQEHIQSVFESMPRRVAAVISNNGGYSGY
ncbi:transposable element Tcb1 transposase [Trichonephila clavipes]|nr:transposable element Tcb1 transposase [Trichonephila clavipes]